MSIHPQLAIPLCSLTQGTAHLCPPPGEIELPICKLFNACWQGMILTALHHIMHALASAAHPPVSQGKQPQTVQRLTRCTPRRSLCGMPSSFGPQASVSTLALGLFLCACAPSLRLRSSTTSWMLSMTTSCGRCASALWCTVRARPQQPAELLACRAPSKWFCPEPYPHASSSRCSQQGIDAVQQGISTENIPGTPDMPMPPCPCPSQLCAVLRIFDCTADRWPRGTATVAISCCNHIHAAVCRAVLCPGGPGPWHELGRREEGSRGARVHWGAGSGRWICGRTR